MRKLTSFLDSDIQTQESKNLYLSYAKNVLIGQNSRLSITGNAYHVVFFDAIAVIESVWDESIEDEIVDLEIFISIVSNWMPVI